MMTEVFVYGTLQRGQCRGRIWPRRPRTIHTAYIRGRLFDLGPYPAIRCDDDELDCDWVAGEVWSFAADDICETIAELDRIEECNQSGAVNLYDRILVRAHRQPGSRQSVLALAYQYSAADSLSDTQRIRCGGNRDHVAWPASGVIC